MVLDFSFWGRRVVQGVQNVFRIQVTFMGDAVDSGVLNPKP